jgi:hypothetical protein
MKTIRQNAKIYIARNRDDSLYLFIDKKPIKHLSYYVSESYWICDNGVSYRCISDLMVELPKKMFPKIKWEDKEPTEIKMSVVDILKKN